MYLKNLSLALFLCFLQACGGGATAEKHTQSASSSVVNNKGGGPSSNQSSLSSLASSEIIVVELSSTSTDQSSFASSQNYIFDQPSSGHSLFSSSISSETIVVEFSSASSPQTSDASSRSTNNGSSSDQFSSSTSSETSSGEVSSTSSEFSSSCSSEQATSSNPSSENSFSSNNSSNQSSSSSSTVIFPSGDLPILKINTTDYADIVSKEIYLNGSFNLIDSNNSTTEGSLEIRGRGNTTWTEMPKKPYRLKLTESTSLLNMPASKHWVLLANYADKTLVRNELAFNVSREIGMEYTPRSQYIDLIINNIYVGVYQLVEHVRIAKDRINIPEMKANDISAEKITGGYLIEIDGRYGEDYCVPSNVTPMVFCLVSPESLLEEQWESQKNYITKYIRDTDNAIFSTEFADPNNGYEFYLDTDSMIKYYLINEILKNIDGNLRLSTFLYKKRGGKLFFGPIWDFDLTVGNANYEGADDPIGWHIRTAPWFHRLFQDPAFSEKVKDHWIELKTNGTLDNLFTFIDNQAYYLHRPQEKNFAIWPILDTWVWPNRVVTGSYQGEIDEMKSWLRTRIEWMDAEFEK